MAKLPHSMRAIFLHPDQIHAEFKNFYSMHECKEWFKKKTDFIRDNFHPEGKYPFGFEWLVLENDILLTITPEEELIQP